MKRFFAALLTVLMLAQSLCVGIFADSEATTYQSDASDSNIVYEESFDSSPDIWSVEPKFESSNVSSLSCKFTAPTVKDGVMYFEEGDSAAIWWGKIPGIKKSGTYTIKFDVKITDFGDDKKLSGGRNAWSREMYVALGGWWDTVYLTSAGSSNIFASKTTAEAEYALGATYSVEIVWDNTQKQNTITSTVKSGDLVVSGTRTCNSTDTQYAECSKVWAFRCEDGAAEISNFSFTDGNVSAGLPENFFPVSMSAGGVWKQESDQHQSSCDPYLADGVLRLDEGCGIAFNWTKVSGVGEYDATKLYKFDFDVKITDFGDGSSLPGRADTFTRALYVGHGGYYNHLELYDKYSKIKVAGNKSVACDTEAYLNQLLHISIDWQNGTVATTVSDAEGNVIVASSRTLSYNERYMPYMVFRCEDGAAEISNYAFTDGTVSYNGFGESFIFPNASAENPLWVKESKEFKPKTDAYVKGGALYLDEMSGVLFDWTKVEGAGEYSAGATYTFDFDFKITDFGDGSQGSNQAQTRALYVGHGGYYTQLTFYDRSNKIGIANGNKTITVTDDDIAKYKDKWMHVTLTLSGNATTTTLTFADGTLIGKGSRTITIDEYVSSISLRCEDGAAVVDNFKFTATDVAKPESATDISIPEGMQAIYEADITYTGEPIKVRLGEHEVFAISTSGISFCSCATKGSYGVGTYHIKTSINPTQKMLITELTLPDGGIIRRGASISNATRDFALEIYGNAGSVLGATVTYENISVDEYTFITDEPVYEGFGANVYNLITSFTDARYDRAFVWTALESYIGDGAMAVKYRAEGESEWTVVGAVREIETLSATEDFFKADIDGLKAATKYEYKIGKKDSSDDNDWSKSYFFTTAEKNVKDFSFIAIGDTQPHSWNGTTSGNKGAMMTQTALTQAFTKTNPAFILNTGDIIENSGKPEQWNIIFKALSEFGAETPHFAAIGNHDGANLFDMHFNHPNNGGSAAVDMEIAGSLSADILDYLDETIYSYNHGGVHFVVLNSGKYSYELDQKLIEAQRAWLIADLEANRDAKWTVVMQHQTTYHRVDGGQNRPWLSDVFENYGVDLVIQGHSHLVTRTYPMKNGQIVTKTSPDVIEKGIGTIYTTIGSTTVNHDGLGNPNMENMQTIVTTDNLLPAYTVVSVEGNKLTVTTRQADGLVLDTFTIVGDFPNCDNGHTYDDEFDTDCNVCGEIREVELPTEGEVSRKIFWAYEDGVLTITGRGKIKNFSAGVTPWSHLANEITKVVIGEGITYIGSSAFYCCANIESVELPESLTAMGNYVFYGCSALKSITIPEAVTEIGKYSFRRSGLENIDFAIGYGWSAGDKEFSIADIVSGGHRFISKSYYKQTWVRNTEAAVETIDPNYVTGGIMHTDVIWELTDIGNGNLKLTIRGNGAMADYGTAGAPWYAYWEQITEIEVQDGVTTVGRCAFYGLKFVRKATLADSVTAIGDYGFYMCRLLKSIELPDGVTIGKDAFVKTGITL